MSLMVSENVFSKTVEPIYEEPFDQGSGGSSLTWATQEGMLINNPAQLPYGGKFIKWLGVKTAIEVGKDSVSIAQTLAKKTKALSREAISEKPLHLGVSQNISFLTNNAGLSVFASVTPDVRLWKEGVPDDAIASPSLVLRNESYNGLIGSFAKRVICNCFSIGASAKYLVASDVVERVDLAAQSQGGGNLSTSRLTSLMTPSQGFGVDLASLLFLQGANVDYRFAGTYSNLGGTKLVGKNTSLLLKPMLNAGAGVTFHSEMNAIHLSADYRDILNATEEDRFKKVFLGSKILFYHLVGFGAGYYNGYPSLAFEVNLFLVRLALTTYTREYGSRPGYDTRGIYVISLSSGFSL